MIRINFEQLCLLVVLVFAFSMSMKSQSTNQGTPTPVVTNEINGIIPARSIGDPRLTNYFFAFNGTQGDVFINIVTKNLDADLDIFAIEGFKALAKITVFSDSSDSETGRIIYLRKFEKLLLRIQGRSPNDEPASFRIKFAGSFQPLPLSAAEEIKAPETRSRTEGEVRVNSVGTIIPTVPEPRPEKATVAKEVDLSDGATDQKLPAKEISVKSVDELPAGESSAKIEISRNRNTAAVKKVEIAETKEQTNLPNIAKPVLIITDVLGKDDPVSETSKDPELNLEAKLKANTDEPDAEAKEVKEEIVSTLPESSKFPVDPVKPELLQKIELVVKFKDGKTVKLPMTKVFSFNVNQGILTIVSSEGNISRYSLLIIEKISIE